MAAGAMCLIGGVFLMLEAFLYGLPFHFWDMSSRLLWLFSVVGEGFSYTFSPVFPAHKLHGIVGLCLPAPVADNQSGSMASLGCYLRGYVMTPSEM